MFRRDQGHEGDHLRHAWLSERHRVADRAAARPGGSPVGALFRRPTFDGRGGGDLVGGTMLYEQPVPKGEAGAAPWLGKVVMLIDERTQSQAEHTGLFFEAMTDVTYIGTPTAGANGDCHPDGAARRHRGVVLGP
jgi:hypothetical protein